MFFSSTSSLYHFYFSDATEGDINVEFYDVNVEFTINYNLMWRKSALLWKGRIYTLYLDWYNRLKCFLFLIIPIRKSIGTHKEGFMNIKERVQSQQNYFATGATKSYSFRIHALHTLSNGIQKYEKEILTALQMDLNKSEAEAYITELCVLRDDLRFIMRHLRNWMKRKRRKTSLALFPAKCYQVPEPYGVALIMSPWNYPFLLTMAPLVGAIAAGNCVVLKPSAYSSHTSAVVTKLIKDCFSPEFCTVIEGGREENNELLKQKFDYIFFTGSISVGKIVMEAAAKHLTPVSLELGGKSPVIIDETADIDLAAKRLVFGKYINAGQTCIAPDYVLVHESKKKELIDHLGQWIKQFYEKNKTHNTIENYPTIINDHHFERLLGLMDGLQVSLGGSYNKESRMIEPTVLTEVTGDSPIMQEEIFGPLLPILTYQDLHEAISFVKKGPKPLALYLFSNDKAVHHKITSEISYGGGCINDVLLHIASPHLPFGGVGDSGMGSYHGKASFDTFTHYKSLVNKGTHLDFSFRYRPYTKKKLNLIKKLL